MATNTNAVGTYLGTDAEDVERWLENSEMFAKISDLGDEELLRITLIGTRGEAQTLVYNLARNKPSLTLKTFKKQAKGIFPLKEQC